MKMTIKIFLTLALALTAVSLKAQNSIYIPGTPLSVGDSVTYIVDGNIVYNSANVMTGLFFPTTYKDGTEIDIKREGAIMNIDETFFPSIRNIIKNTLSYEERKRIGEEEDFILIFMYFDTDTGKLIEPEFLFSNSTTGFASIPVEKLYQIDMAMRNLSIGITEYGKTWSWMYMVYKVYSSGIKPVELKPFEPNINPGGGGKSTDKGVATTDTTTDPPGGVRP